MGSAVLAHGNAAVAGSHLHIQVGIADGVTDLLKGTAGGEHGEAGSEGHQSHGGSASGHGHHVFFGNAAVEVTVRERLAEHTGLGCTGQVGVKNDQIVMLGAQLHQSLAVAVTGRAFLQFCHVTSPPLLPAWPSVPPWRSHTRHHWEPCHASRHCPPYRTRPCPSRSS